MSLIVMRGYGRDQAVVSLGFGRIGAPVVPPDEPSLPGRPSLPGQRAPSVSRWLAMPWILSPTEEELLDTWLVRLQDDDESLILM